MNKTDFAELKEINRFWSRVSISEENECWHWDKPSVRGYGVFYVNKKRYLAHRYSCLISQKKSIKNKCVCHKCDTPSCVNPNHLFVGTQKDNVLDMIKKGRKVHANKIKKICKRGHDLNGDFSYLYLNKRTGKTYRKCMLCRKITDDLRPRQTTRRTNPIFLTNTRLQKLRDGK